MIPTTPGGISWYLTVSLLLSTKARPPSGFTAKEIQDLYQTAIHTVSESIAKTKQQ